MKLTRALIDAGRTEAGAFSLQQLRVLRIPLPTDRPGAFPAQGWIDRMNHEVTEAEYAEFLRLGGMTRTERRDERKALKKEARLKVQPLLFSC